MASPDTIQLQKEREQLLGKRPFTYSKTGRFVRRSQRNLRRGF